MNWQDEVKSVLEGLDELAEIWGDEGKFRRCRDRLRQVLARAAERQPAEESPLNDLRDAAENLADSAIWYPCDSVGTPELLVATEDMNHLRDALKTLETLDEEDEK